MSNDMVVGSIRSTTTPPLTGGIYEALLEKAERDNAELADRLSGLELSTTQKLAQLEQERNEAREALSEWEDAVKHVEADHPDEVHCGCVPVLRKLLNDAKKENEEQARLLGMGSEREARLITERNEALKEKEKWGLYAEKIERERDHYKQALEEISTTIQEYKDSMIQEPAEDFVWAIKAWADKKLKEI